jgi:hypothetical protein
LASNAKTASATGEDARELGGLVMGCRRLSGRALTSDASSASAGRMAVIVELRP